MSKGARHRPPWKDGFLFLGNQPALDLLNTRPVLGGTAVELLPDFLALLRWFRAAGLLSSQEASRMQRRWSGSRRARRALESIRALREALRKQVVAWEGGGELGRAMVVRLNRLLAEHPMRTRLIARGKAPVTELWFGSGEPEDLLAPLAESAAELFAGVDRTRVRQCSRCILHYYDASKKGSRRWCSMRLCGNRQKVAAYAARQREDDPRA